MPIAKWYCGACKAEKSLDHFDQSECGLTYAHPDYCAAILRDDNTREGVHVTDLLGCPRKAAIMRTEPYAVDPLSLNAAETGKAWHTHMEKGAASPIYHFPHTYAEAEVSGTIAGIKVVGRVDRLRPPSWHEGMAADDHIPGVIEDWKHQSDFAASYLAKEGAKPAHTVQLSLYAELVSQTFGWRPAFGVVWYHWSGQGAKAMKAVRVELLALEAALAHHPYECEFSVAQLLGQAASGKHWKELPLAGETILFGNKTGCDYCPVAGVCKKEALGAPF